MAPPSRVFTVPASAPFLRTVIDALVAGKLVPGFPASSDPLALAAATLYLPTRRACRLARDVFLAALGGGGAVLPRIVAIGDIDEDELVFADAATGALAAPALDLPPALGSLERRMLLAKLVLQWAASPELHGATGAPLVAHSPAAALALADDLARLIDDMTTRQVDWERLDDLVPERFDIYWQLTLKFLTIARAAWPAILADRGAVEAAVRRDHLIAAETARLAARPEEPVIAAGSTGSMPATAALLAAVAKLPHGAVVLPGLDTDLDAASFAMIAGHALGHPGDQPTPAAAHPQFAMQALLARMELDRSAVTVLASPAAHGREKLTSEALRPAAATERWKERLDAAVIARAVEGIAVIEAANSDEEATAIAVALREAVEDPRKTAALITPDRALARRVAASLARWGIAVDDSSGEALAESDAGRFALLAAEVALGELAPVPLLALLKHRRFRLGAASGGLRRATVALERALLRGPRPRAGSAGLAHALDAFRREQPRLHPADPRGRIAADAITAAAELIARLRAALAPLEGLGRGEKPFGEIAARHRAVVEALGTDDAGGVAAFAERDGLALRSAFEDIVARPANEDLRITPDDYAELLQTAIADRVVRPPGLPTARVKVYGLLEARLQAVDRAVLGGLVEGCWPPDVRSDPWLSRPMRQALGLDLPERRIGLTAHDFAQALGAPEAILCRPARRAGSPTVASRFLQRLAAVIGREPWVAALARGNRYLAWARRLDQPAVAQRIKAPAPTPPVEARPTALSVTEIEHWLRDPYTIYAKHVLRLAPLDPVDLPPGAADRGTAIHGAIGDFVERFATQLPLLAVEELLALGRARFAPLEDYPEARAFWWPRFERIARWFAVWEAQRRLGLAKVHAEIRGEIEIATGGRPLKLSARADRIEQRLDGSYAIVDFKTGKTASEKQVRSGLSPQLTLEAAILRRGGFRQIAAPASVAEIVYVALRGGDPAGRHEPIEFKEGTPDQQADRALARLTELAIRFARADEPYRSLVSPLWSGRYGDYDHLARVREWSAVGDGDENGETA
jgi:ATP-dependent helicase/nuclease subunit B